MAEVNIPDATAEYPFGAPEPVAGWRAAPDCGRCNDTGRFREARCNEQHKSVTIEAHCTCKKGRRMSEVWYADREGYDHPDGVSPEARAEMAAGL